METQIDKRKMLSELKRLPLRRVYHISKREGHTSMEKTYLTGALLIDSTGATPLRDPAILVEGDRIVAVGTRETLLPPEGAKTVDCGGGTLLAGLIDAHAHAGEDSGRAESVKDQHLKPDALRAIRGSISLYNDLMAGVTTERLLGDGTGCIDVILRDAIARGEILGPRLQAAAQAIRPRHGTALEIGVYADGVEQVRSRVREAIFLGADVIKLFVSNITRGDTYLDYLKGDLTGVAAYTKEEMAVAVEEAHRTGLKVAAHCIGGPAIRWALEAGIDSLEHVNLLQEEDIPYFLQYGGYISDPNFILFFDPELGFESPTNKTHIWNALPAWWHEKVWLARERTRAVMRKALDAGVKFALATDLNHSKLYLECKYFVEQIGATPMQALFAVTRDSATLLGLGDEIGTVECGKAADIICVSRSPLERVDHLKDVTMVMQQGRIVKRI